MKTTLVTGATGFLGKHLVEQLKRTERDVRVRVLCRGISPWDAAEGVVPPREAQGPSNREPENLQVEVVRGDVTSREDVAHAAEGAGEIYHLAGVVSRNPKDNSLLFRTHIEGARNVCEAAKTHGANKLVFVSSSGTIAVSRESIVHDEKSGYKHELVSDWPYYLSKIFAEKLAFSYWERHRLPIVVVNPSLLLGPGDDRNSSTRDVALFLKGQVLAIPLGGLNFIDVRDAASGLVAAMRAGKPGERYLLGGPNWTFGEFIENVSKVSGVRAPKMRPSLSFSLLSARALRRIYGLVGKSFDLDDGSIRMSSLFWYCNSDKARAELGFQTREPQETLKDTVEDVRRRIGKN